MDLHKTCSRCLMDDTVSSIIFDENGVCNYCKKHDALLSLYSQDSDIRDATRKSLIEKIISSGKKKKYDCIVGISGGTDSTYALLQAVKLGLRPLAVFFDNGWSTETSVSNIKNAVQKLKVDLFTYVVDWEEFREIQIAFLKASVPCVEVPTDVAIMGTLYKLARQEKIKYILSGASFITEGIVPLEWSFIDGKYVKSVNKLFGKQHLKSYPGVSLVNVFVNTFFRRIRVVLFTNYFDYDKVKAREVLEKELGWKYYGGHHYENVYSRWAFGWYTVHKFGFDKRKVSLSGPMRMGKLTRLEAMKEISSEPEIGNEVTEYVIKKLQLTHEELENIMKSPNKSFHDYKTSYSLIKKFRFLLKLAIKINLITPVAFYKYFEK
jgi:N-acetyl sugar amidotransferase